MFIDIDLDILKMFSLVYFVLCIAFFVSGIFYFSLRFIICCVGGGGGGGDCTEGCGKRKQIVVFPRIFSILQLNINLPFSLDLHEVLIYFPFPPHDPF